MNPELQRRLDRIESELAIQRLVHEYCHGADKRDLDRFASVWSHDAVWEVSEQQVFIGVEAICEAVEWQWRTFEQMHHWTANLVVDFQDDIAAGLADVDVTVQFADGTWMRAGGTYTDQYVRTAEGWRIGQRRARLNFSLDPVSADGRDE